MPPSRDISLHESLATNVDVQDQENDVGGNPLQQRESHRKRACVLAGSAILQLPIWGRLSPS